MIDRMKFFQTNKTTMLVSQQSIAPIYCEEFTELWDAYTKAYGAFMLKGDYAELMTDAFLLGIMAGKRIERERRRTAHRRSRALKAANG